jgi:pimeloyl-ACP methyl ester carboxylesterase
MEIGLPQAFDNSSKQVGLEEFVACFFRLPNVVRSVEATLGVDYEGFRSHPGDRLIGDGPLLCESTHLVPIGVLGHREVRGHCIHGVSFVEAGYTISLVGHKPNLPHGCTLADMAEDYAGLIVEEFGGKVDLVVGDSGGGMISSCVAARHPELFAHIAMVVAGYTLDEAYKAADLESARLLNAGRRTDAAAVMVNSMFPASAHPLSPAYWHG